MFCTKCTKEIFFCKLLVNIIVYFNKITFIETKEELSDSGSTNVPSNVGEMNELIICSGIRGKNNVGPYVGLTGGVDTNKVPLNESLCGRGSVLILVPNPRVRVPTLIPPEECVGELGIVGLELCDSKEGPEREPTLPN